jgi:Exonuclease VII small subunit
MITHSPYQPYFPYQPYPPYKKTIMKQEIKYEEAVSQLEDIVRKMENNELDIDQLGEQLKKAQMLLKLCKDRLTKTDEEIKKILESNK